MQQPTKNNYKEQCMSRILSSMGGQVYVEYEDPYTGEMVQEWQRDDRPRCGCGQRLLDECSLVRETTFTETFACGYVYKYSNTHGYDDNLISVKGKRVK